MNTADLSDRGFLWCLLKIMVSCRLSLSISAIVVPYNPHPLEGIQTIAHMGFHIFFGRVNFFTLVQGLVANVEAKQKQYYGPGLLD